MLMPYNRVQNYKILLNIKINSTKNPEPVGSGLQIFG